MEYTLGHNNFFQYNIFTIIYIFRGRSRNLEKGRGHKPNNDPEILRGWHKSKRKF